MHGLLALSIAELEEEDEEDEVASLENGNEYDLKGLLCYVQFQFGFATVGPLVHLDHGDDDQLDSVDYHAQEEKDRQPVPELVVGANLVLHAQGPRHLLDVVHGPQIDNCDEPHSAEDVDLLHDSV